MPCVSSATKKAFALCTYALERRSYVNVRSLVALFISLNSSYKTKHMLTAERGDLRKITQALKKIFYYEISCLKYIQRHCASPNSQGVK